MLPNFFHVIVAIVISLCGSLSIAMADQLTVHFRSGTSLTGNIAESSVAWTTVAANGAVSKFVYKTNQIKLLSLSMSESSAQMIRIRQLLNQLGDSNYHQRALAQQRLKAIGGQFRSTVESFADHPSYEVRYRVKRLLSDNKFKPTTSARREVDRITLVDGSKWEGEATDLALTLTAYGKTIQLNRQNVARLTAPSNLLDDASNAGDATVGDAAVGEPVEVNLFHRYEDFTADDQKEFRFDVQPDGRPYPFKTKIDQAFVSKGLLFKSVERGFVGISSFSFKYEPLPVGGRSAGLMGQKRGRDYKGVMEITFCEPGNAHVPAGVHEFGTFIAKVNFRRDMILEAYGALGQLLATVEATDQKCVFAGVKSNQLITKVRILSNPYLKKIERRIDDDFAIDTLRMSTPVPTRVHRLELNREVILKNGDLIQWAGMNIKPESKLFIIVRKVADRKLELLFPLEDVSFVNFARSSKSSNAWQTLLSDGSRINVLPGELFRSEQFDFEVKPTDFVGCWPAASMPRLPVAGDFVDGRMGSVIVFPTCRFRSNSVDFSSDRLSWGQSEKLEQPLQLGDKDSDEDPTPKQTAFKYNDTLANQLPTVWMRPPTVLASEGSYIQLTDGQRLAFGDQGNFVLKEIGTRSITVAYRQGNDKKISYNDVYSIQFGDK